MESTGARIITTLLEREGVSIVAGVPGGCNLPLYDALRSSRIRHVLARHEQGAGFIAQGMARVTGMPAVCLGTSGPGATNLLTAIADAKLDSIPLVAITGQVPRALIGTDASSPTLVLKGIDHPDHVYQELRGLIQQARQGAHARAMRQAAEDALDAARAELVRVERFEA